MHERFSHVDSLQEYVATPVGCQQELASRRHAREESVSIMIPNSCSWLEEWSQYDHGAVLAADQSELLARFLEIEHLRGALVAFGEEARMSSPDATGGERRSIAERVTRIHDMANCIRALALRLARSGLLTR